jgi:uncharacterized membrane protein YfcA
MTWHDIAVWLGTHWADITIFWITVAVSYIVFGIAGFGAVLLASPILAHRMPVASIVPLIALLDFAAAVVNGFKFNENIVRRELSFLVPLMVIGSIIGIRLLISIPANYMSVALGVFIIGYALYGLFAPSMHSHLGQWWVFPFGLAGGLLSGMFGSGGFLYAIYLSRRLDDKEAIRATMSGLIGLSSMTRLIIFLAAGVFDDLRLLLMAALGVPAMLIGIFIGHRITIGLSREQFMRLIYAILIGTGASLVLRF